MSEDEIIEIVKNEITNTYSEVKAKALQGLLDLYQKLKEINKIKDIVIKNYQVIATNPEDYIYKDKIREKIKEIDNYTFMSNEEMKQQDYAIIKLEELLEENNEM